MHLISRAAICGLVLLASACSQTAGSGDLAADAGSATATWVALDLADGSIAAVADPDPADPRWRGASILFRLVEPSETRVGRPVADELTDPDERPPRLAHTGRLWIGVFELTQAQWQRLAGTSPWYETLPFFDLDNFVSGDRPAFALAPADVEPAIAAWSAHGWTLDLPSEAEWELACLAGDQRKFAWGDGCAPADAAPWAVCDAGDGSPARPQPVGSRGANAWGLFDLHGNAWEIVRGSDGFEARGGAWDQAPMTCRTSNRLPLSEETVGWNVGARLVLRR